MADFLATHDMSSFLINPVMAVDNSMETFERISMSTATMPKVHFEDFPLDNNNTTTTGDDDEDTNAVDTSNKLSSIQDFFNHRLSSSYYSSDEEAASPQGSSDSLSMRSFDEDVIIETPKVGQVATYDADITVEELFLKPERLASSCVKIEHRCNRAQAVTLKTVGKPKVVSMPRSSQPSSPTSVKPAVRPSLTHARTSSRRSIRPSLEAVVRVSKVLEEELASSQTPVIEKPAQPRTSTSTSRSNPSRMSRRPSIPLLRAATTFDPFKTTSNDLAPTTATPPRKGVLIKRAHTTSAPRPSTRHTTVEREESPALPEDSPSKRRLHRLASSFSLSNAGDLLKRKSSIASLRKSLAAPPIPTEPLPQLAPIAIDTATPRVPAGPIPKRRSSIGKLTPRGPTERAPILVLPPHPDEEDVEDDDFLSVSPVEALQKWDRARARKAAKKEKPSIDDIMARLM